MAKSSRISGGFTSNSRRTEKPTLNVFVSFIRGFDSSLFFLILGDGERNPGLAFVDDRCLPVALEEAPEEGPSRDGSGGAVSSFLFSLSLRFLYC